MLWVFLTMFLTLCLAAVVAGYVAFPRRGRDLPYAPGVGLALARAAQALPVLDEHRTHRSR